MVAWGVARVAELILDTYDIQPWAMQMILAVLGIGFPVCLLFSWVFDLRWENFLTKIGKSEAQLEAIEFDVKLPY